ncbi:DUF1861 family protein [Candidatus Parcubacteria bacterium]|nr:DUF1861 family protein [Candidatus Parcubacteria bacterium]
MEKEKATQENIDKMLEDFNKKKQLRGEKLKFEGVGNKDVYNPTAPFEYHGKRYLIGRVESPDKQTDSQSIFFKEEDGVWRQVKGIPPLDLQDPFFTQIDGELIVGGVKVFPREPTPENQDELSWLTVYYRGTDPANLEEFAQGPEHMKDLRIIKLPNSKIGVFTRPSYIQTRPQDGVGGMIKYTEIDSLEDLTIENINKAEIIDDLFTKNEWGGANELYLLANGWVGILGHIARYNEKGDKEYYAMTFEFDPQTREVSNKKIITVRDNFPKGKKKSIKSGKKKSDDYLGNIFYPGGMVMGENGMTELYGGLSDSEAGKITIEYPFSSQKRTLT